MSATPDPSRPEDTAPSPSLADLERAWQSCPDNPLLLEALARATQQQGRWQEAADRWQQALAKAPKAESAMALHRCLSELRRPAEALAALRQAVALDPQRADHRALLGRELLLGGQAQEGEAQLREAQQSDPGNLVANLTLAALYKKRGQTPLALECYQRAAEAEPSRADLQLQLGVLALNGERLDLARQALLEVVRLSSEPQPTALTGLAQIELKQGRAAAALPYFQQALEAQPRLAAAVHSVAVLFIKEHDRQGLTQFLQRLWQSYADRPQEVSANAALFLSYLESKSLWPFALEVAELLAQWRPDQARLEERARWALAWAETLLARQETEAARQVLDRLPKEAELPEELSQKHRELQQATAPEPAPEHLSEPRPLEHLSEPQPSEQASEPQPSEQASEPRPWEQTSEPPPEPPTLDSVPAIEWLPEAPSIVLEDVWRAPLPPPEPEPFEGELGEPLARGELSEPLFEKKPPLPSDPAPAFPEIPAPLPWPPAPPSLGTSTVFSRERLFELPTIARRASQQPLWELCMGQYLLAQAATRRIPPPQPPDGPSIAALYRQAADAFRYDGWLEPACTSLLMGLMYHPGDPGVLDDLESVILEWVDRLQAEDRSDEALQLLEGQWERRPSEAVYERASLLYAGWVDQLHRLGEHSHAAALDRQAQERLASWRALEEHWSELRWPWLPGTLGEGAL